MQILDANPTSHIALISLGMMWIYLFSFQLWEIIRADCVFYHWYDNQSRRRKTEFKPVEHSVKSNLASYPAFAEELGKYIVLLKIGLVSDPAFAEGLVKHIVLLKIDLVSHPALAEVWVNT